VRHTKFGCRWQLWVIFDRVGRFCLPVFFRVEPESGPKAGLETGGMRVTLRSALGL
jgi:hypothetical protein